MKISAPSSHPCPSFLFQSTLDPPPVSHLLCLSGSKPQFPLHQSFSCVPPPPTTLPCEAPFSFIHILPLKLLLVLILYCPQGFFTFISHPLPSLVPSCLIILSFMGASSLLSSPIGSFPFLYFPSCFCFSCRVL